MELGFLGIRVEVVWGEKYLNCKIRSRDWIIVVDFFMYNLKNCFKDLVFVYLWF